MACKTFHKGKYYVTFKRGFEDNKRDITVSVDKVFENDTLKISLSDEDNPQFLCVLTITRIDYEDLKKQQGLLVDFDNFPSQLVRLLQQCASNNMFLIMQQTNPIQYYFEVVEHNEFKRLVHLSLRTGPATDADIKQHMADTICLLKKTLSALKSSAISNETLLNDKCINMERKIQDLSHVITKMEEDKKRREIEFQESLKQERERLELERLQWKRSTDTNMKNQVGDFQEIINKKDRQIDEMNSHNRQLKENISQLENQISDKSQRLNLLETEVQKTHIEVATLKAKNISLERDVAEKEKQCSQQHSRCAYLDKIVKENADTIKELNISLHTIKKEKTSLEERLAITESIINKNTDTAQTTAEQLLKANQIISKQNTDLIEMKEKLLCRTAIALEQEKVIESNVKEMEELRTRISTTNVQMDKLMSELDSIKEKYEANENALKDRDETIKNNNMVIQWLHKKMEGSCPPTDILHSKRIGIQMATSSTPYFLSKNNTTSSHGVSDESIDFYGTSKMSNIDDSPGPDVLEKNGKVGLDPKYLQPASSNSQNTSKRVIKSRSNEDQLHKGKENVNLPKVDYREKKTSRSTTYRTTPVSAYFS